MISIVVPVFNAENTIKRCIESVLRQTYTDYELILINDGSIDKSAQICKDYVSNKVHLYNKINGGVSSARNWGINKSNGEFITFLDADDYVGENWLSDYIENYNGEDILYQNSIWHKADGSLFYRQISHIENISTLEYIKMLYTKNTLNFVWAALFKSNIIKNNNVYFNENLKYSEDCDFILRYCKYVNTIRILPCQNYHYIVPSSIKSYFLPSIEKVNAIYQVCKDGIELTGDASKKSIFIIRYSNELIYTILMMYKLKVPYDIRLSILHIISRMPYKKNPSSIRLKIINLFILNNIKISDFFFNIILK